MFALGDDVGNFIYFGERQQLDPVLDFEVSFEVISRPSHALEQILMFQIVADSKVLGHCLDTGWLTRK